MMDSNFYFLSPLEQGKLLKFWEVHAHRPLVQLIHSLFLFYASNENQGARLRRTAALIFSKET